MQSALSVIGVFPPPSSRADILAGFHGACTGLAADAGITFVVKLVIRNAMLMDIVPHLLFGPFDERVHLDESVYVVPFHEVHVLAGHALLSSQSAHPHVESLHSSVQGLQLTDLTTAMTALHRVVEQVDVDFFEVEDISNGDMMSRSANGMYNFKSQLYSPERGKYDKWAH